MKGLFDKPVARARIKPKPIYPKQEYHPDPQAPWRTIKEAPKDKRILVCWKDRVGKWHRNIAVWDDAFGRYLTDGGCALPNLYGWQPLPKLPKED